jgi:para-aminobenzoate synthetase component 1
MAWREPLEVFAPFANEPFAVLLLSGPGGRWSYMARMPTAHVEAADFTALRTFIGPSRPTDPDGPPFQGGVIGLASYELGWRLDAAVGTARAPCRAPEWPDLILARYEAVLAFDHQGRAIVAIGGAEAWLDADRPAASPPARPACLTAEASGAAYECAVAEVKGAIAAGEIFQANIARAWSGRLGANDTPFTVFRRLVTSSPAPFSAYWRLPVRAITSHSPERFISLCDGAARAQPIKGTAARSADPAEDALTAAGLLVSAKDRAENLMIVDLMRNDLARVCEPGSVKVEALCALESFAAVHHLVSTVRGRLCEGCDVADLLAAVFPPGSITGAPKRQAMKVIARHEAGPRGPWCGSLFWAGFDGAMDSSVLIRTAGFIEDAGGWRVRVQAGAGIVADSDPAAERAEVEVKASGLLRALAA